MGLHIKVAVETVVVAVVCLFIRVVVVVVVADTCLFIRVVDGGAVMIAEPFTLTVEPMGTEA